MLRNSEKPAQAESKANMRYAVQSKEAKIKGQDPVDPFLPEVFDHQKQANKQHRTYLS